MKIDLTGRTALVTGSTAGIGFAIADALASCGATVIVNGRTEARVNEALGKLKAKQASAKFAGVAADVSTDEGCRTLVAAAPDVDILVNNAGIFRPKDFFETPDTNWEATLSTNVMSGVRLSRAYLQSMAKRGWGRVIFISSESGLNIPVEMIDYGVSKTAMLSLSRGLAKRMAGTGVTVNAVLPGPTLSDGVVEMLRSASDGSRPVEDVANDFVRAHRSSSIIRRAAKVEEVANLVAYVASPLSSATTGAALRVDGGVVDTIA